MNRLELCAALAGKIGLSTTNQSATLIALLNEAGQEIWDQTDLPSSLREQVFTIDADDPVPRITFPQYVGQLRGFRDNFDKIRIHDMRPKYYTGAGRDWLRTFRVLHTSPIARSIDNSLTVEMTPIDSTVNVHIIGSTDTAAEVHADFNQDGEGTAVGVLWTDIRSITKDTTTTEDIILTQDGNELARIHNNAAAARYTIVELQEIPYYRPDVNTQVRYIECLYKLPFYPLLNDGAVYQIQDYDQIMLATAVKNYRIGALGASATDPQIAAAKVQAVRADELLERKFADHNQAIEMPLQFGDKATGPRYLRGLRARRY